MNSYLEDFEYAGQCVMCDTMLDMDDAGFCDTCKGSFCWERCGTWHNGQHACQDCIDDEERTSDE